MQNIFLWRIINKTILKELKTDCYKTNHLTEMVTIFVIKIKNTSADVHFTLNIFLTRKWVKVHSLKHKAQYLHKFGIGHKGEIPITYTKLEVQEI